MKYSLQACVALATLLLAIAPGHAQDAEESTESAIPDPATIEVPEIVGGRDEKVVKNGWKYFYFWRENTTFEQAYSDFSDCYRFLPVPGSHVILPTFVAWQGPEDQHVLKRIGPAHPYGIVGDVIGAMVAGPIERRASQSRMRRCLEPRGYLRFPVPEETWEEIVDNYSLGSIAVKAKLASGPRPNAEPLPETR